jgi:hypothetical protein
MQPLTDLFMILKKIFPNDSFSLKIDSINISAKETKYRASCKINGASDIHMLVCSGKNVFDSGYILAATPEEAVEFLIKKLEK